MPYLDIECPDTAYTAVNRLDDEMESLCDIVKDVCYYMFEFKFPGSGNYHVPMHFGDMHIPRS